MLGQRRRELATSFVESLLQLLHPLLRGLAKVIGEICERVDQASYLHEWFKLGGHSQIVVVRKLFYCGNTPSIFRIIRSAH